MCPAVRPGPRPLLLCEVSLPWEHRPGQLSLFCSLHQQGPASSPSLCVVIHQQCTPTLSCGSGRGNLACDLQGRKPHSPPWVETEATAQESLPGPWPDIVPLLACLPSLSCFPIALPLSPGHYLHKRPAAILLSVYFQGVRPQPLILTGVTSPVLLTTLQGAT